MSRPQELVLSISKRTAAIGLVLGLLAWASWALTETYKFTVMLPSPSGTFEKLVATKSALLARSEGRVGIRTGSSTPLAELDVRGKVQVSHLFRFAKLSSDPACLTGAAYYNTALNKFRACQSATWSDMGGSSGQATTGGPTTTGGTTTTGSSTGGTTGGDSGGDGGDSGDSGDSGDGGDSGDEESNG